ncbi:hypothetical protein ABZP36_014060 [Zizania latifolia]
MGEENKDHESMGEEGVSEDEGKVNIPKFVGDLSDEEMDCVYDANRDELLNLFALDDQFAVDGKPFVTDSGHSASRKEKVVSAEELQLALVPSEPKYKSCISLPIGDSALTGTLGGGSLDSCPEYELTKDVEKPALPKIMGRKRVNKTKEPAVALR